MSHTPGPWRTDGDRITTFDGSELALIAMFSEKESVPELFALCQMEVEYES
jgi:hypothetical protein